MNEFHEMSERFTELLENQKQYHDDFLHEVMKNKLQIKYSHNPIIELYPFENESFGLKKGFEIDELKTLNSNSIKTYFDENDFFVMVEDVLSGNRVTSRSFYSRSEDFIEKVVFQKIGAFKLKSLSRFYSKKDKPLYFNKGVKGSALWEFNYIDDILLCINIIEGDSLLEEVNKRKLTFSFDDDKLREVLCEYDSGSTQVMFKAPK